MKRRRWMLTAVVALAGTAFFASAPLALAEDEPKPDQLKQMYQDTLAQLKSAQERKTQLAAENEQLKAKVAELEKQMQANQAKTADLEKQVSSSAEKNFYLRSHYVAWQEFLRRYPRLQIRWRVFLENDLITPRSDLPVFVDPEWPWSAQS
jgi:septal ring factor EnvC (AmiA/AmiB activator)